MKREAGLEYQLETANRGDAVAEAQRVRQQITVEITSQSLVSGSRRFADLQSSI